MQQDQIVTEESVNKQIDQLCYDLHIYGDVQNTKCHSQDDLNRESYFLKQLHSFVRVNLEYDQKIKRVASKFRNYLERMPNDSISLLETEVMNLEHQEMIDLCELICLVEDIEGQDNFQILVNQIMFSKVVEHYIDMLKLNNLVPIYKQWTYPDINDIHQVNYFKTKRCDILAVLTFDSTILINSIFQMDSHSNNIWKAILYVHSKLLSKKKTAVIIYSSSNFYPYLESEVMPFVLRESPLGKAQREYLINGDSWRQTFEEFKQFFPYKQELIRYKCEGGILNKIRPQNFLMQYQTQQILQILKLRTHDKLDQIEPCLQMNFTISEYFSAILFKLAGFMNKNFLAMNYEVPLIQAFQKIFEVQDSLQLLLTMNEFLKFISLDLEESYELWIHFLKYEPEERLLDHQDIELVNKIVRSSCLRKIIVQINQMKGRQLNESEIEQQYLYFNQYMHTVPFLLFGIDYDLYGIHLINGQIALNTALFRQNNQNKQISRAQRIVTIVHELYCHHQRQKFVCQGNVLESTPPKYKEIEFNSECGKFFEIQTFGRHLLCINQDEADFILNESNWNLDDVEYLERFKRLNTLTPQQMNQLPSFSSGKRGSYSQVQQLGIFGNTYGRCTHGRVTWEQLNSEISEFN